MDPCIFANSFPFVPPDVLCRIHDVLLPAAPLGVSSVPLAATAGPPPGETLGPAEGGLEGSRRSTE